MILYATKVEYRGDYRLFLEFNNGENGVVDLAERLHGEMFEPLKDVALFATAHHDPDIETVAWASGADLAPEYLLDLLRQQKQRVA